jgi:zinc protease
MYHDTMRYFKLPIAAAAIGLLASGAAFAQAPKKPAAKPAAPIAHSNPAAAPSAAGIKKLTSVEGITEYELPNGLHVLLFPDQSKPTITVNITYKVGSRMEGYGESGMAHLLEHMVFKGCTKHPHIPAELSSHGASPNGTTSDDRTNYFETFNATDENLNWALDMESDRMVNSFIKQEDLQSEFTVVRNEFERGENSPQRILNERIMSTAFLWHNYGKSTIGSKEDIERVPIKNLQAFYKKYYQPDNSVLMVTGKIDEEKTLGLINKYFGPIPHPTRVLQPDYTVEPVQDGERSVILSRVGDVQDVACAYHIPAGSHPDYPALDVLAEVMSNEPEGRIYKALVKSGKASSAYAYAEGKHDPGVIYFNAEVRKERSLDSARMALYAAIEDVMKNPPTDAEVAKAKTKLLSDFDNMFRKSNVTGLIMSEFIGQGDWRLAFIYRDSLKHVTPADVSRVARQYLKASNRTTGLFIPTNMPDRSQIPATPDVAKLVENYKGGAALAAGEAFEATPDNIDKRTEVFNLTSGAKIALLEKSTRGNSVEARITLRLGDEGSMMNKAAIADVTADMLMRGTQKHTRAQINEELDKLSSKLSIGGQGQTVGIVITSTKQNLPAVLDLVDEILHQPAFPPDEFKALIEENLAGIESQKSEPQAIASNEMSRVTNIFPVGHILYPMSFDEDVVAYKAVSLEDVRKFHTDYYNGSSATGAIVGDFDVPAIKQRLNKMFDNWNAVKSYTRVPNPYHDVAVKNLEFKTPDKKMAMFVAAQPIKMRDDNTDYPAMLMANYILGGGFLNSRLATRIRQKEGISYGVGSSFAAPSLDDYATLNAFAIYNPDNKAKLEAAWKEEMNRIINEGVTEDELKDAKSGFLQSRATARANDANLAGALSNNLFLGRTMQFSKGIDEKISALTTADVNAAVKKYVSPDKAIVIKAGDFK